MRADGLRGALAIAVFLGGCGDAASAEIDGGTADTGADVMASDTGPMLQGSDPSLRDGGGPSPLEVEIEPPEIPWVEDGEPDIAPPVLTPCPAGWSEVLDGTGVTYCEPWAAGAAEGCGVGEAHLAGSSGCAPIGTACPVLGDFATDLPGGTILYVLEGAVGPRNGTMASPYDELGDVDFDSLAPGTTIALGRGTYTGPIDLPAGVSLWGACAEETSIVGAAGPEPVVNVTGAGAEIHNLRIGPTTREGIGVTTAGAELTLRGVELSELSCVALRAEGSVTVDADGLIVRDVDACRAVGRTVQFADGATATVRNAFLARVWGVDAVSAAGTSTEVSLERMALMDAVLPDGVVVAPYHLDPTMDVCHLRAESMADGVVASAIDDFIAEGPQGAVACSMAVGADMSMSNALLRAPTEGVRILEGATGSVRRVAIDENQRRLQIYGISAQPTAAAAVQIEDVLVIDSFGGVAFEGNFQSEVRRLVIARNDTETVGSHLELYGGTHVVEDIRIEDTRTSNELIIGPDGEPVLKGGGIAVVAVGVLGPLYGATHLVLRRASIEQVLQFGIVVLGVLFGSGVVEAEDVVVRDLIGPAGTDAAGLWLNGGFAFDARRTLIDEAWGTGVHVFGGSSSSALHLQDSVIRRAQPTDLGLGARGLRVSAGTAALDRVRIVDNRDVAVGAWGGESRVELTDVAVERTEPRGCAEDEVACVPAGHGVGVYAGASLIAEGFGIRSSALCGVQLGAGSAADLHRGEVSGALVGLCLQADPYDVARLTSEVRYSDNGINLQATRLPVPDTSVDPVTE